MSLKMLDFSVAEEGKFFDSSSWADSPTDTEVEDNVSLPADVHSLPTTGLRGFLTRINWIFPILSGCIFLATQLGLILYWVNVADETTAYATMHKGQTVPYLSDIGANEMKPLFITGFTRSALFFSLGLTIDRWAVALSLPKSSITKWQRVRSIMMVVVVWVGSAFLVVMTCLDTSGTRGIHTIFLFVFFFKYAGLAVTFCVEMLRHGEYP
ncbi:unnamed protein product [Discula destructiva]